MEIHEAIEIIKRLSDGLSDNGYVKKANDMAILALQKQIPTKPIIESWSPARCPYCRGILSESVGDGYYKHWYSKTFCDCGQKLKWD